MGDGRGSLVNFGHLLQRTSEEGDRIRIGLAQVRRHEILRGSHDDGGFDACALVRKCTMAIELLQACRHAGQAAEMPTGGPTDDADALGVELQRFGIRFQAANGSFAIVQRSRKFGLLAQAIAHQRGDVTTLRKPLHHGLISLDLAGLPAASMDVQNAWPHTFGIGHIHVEFDVVFGVRFHQQRLQGEACRCLRDELLPLRSAVLGGAFFGRGICGLQGESQRGSEDEEGEHFHETHKTAYCPKPCEVFVAP